MNVRVLVIAGIGVLAVGGIGWFLADRLILREYREIVSQTEKYEADLAAAERGAAGSRDIKLGLRDAARTMLGAEQNVVEHRLRTLLSELSDKHGLEGVVVTHGRPRAAGNPADDRSSGVSRGLRRRLGERPDFAVVRGRVQGVGTLDEVVRTLAALRAQPWIHRVEGFSIEPEGKDREVFGLKADFATIFAPDLVSEYVDADAPLPALVEPGADDVRALAAVVARSPFRFAEPPVVTPPPTPPVRVVEKPVEPPSAPPPPYDKWRVTGVMEPLGGPEPDMGGIEVFLARTDTGETRVLTIGQSVLGAVLTRAEGERAWFDKDGEAVVVRAGETLDRARPVETVHSEARGTG